MHYHASAGTHSMKGFCVRLRLRMHSSSRFLITAALVGGSVFFAPRIVAAQPFLGYEQLHVSLGGPADAEYQFDGVIEGSDGRIYGAAVNGGPQDGGVVFRMNKNGSGYEILRAFTVSTNDGLSP